jgi:hypothetical protein
VRDPPGPPAAVDVDHRDVAGVIAFEHERDPLAVG